MGAGASICKSKKYTLSVDVQKELDKPQDASDLGSYTYRLEVKRLRTLFKKLIYEETERIYGTSLHRAAAEGNVGALVVLFNNGVNGVNEINASHIRLINLLLSYLQLTLTV